MIVERADDAGEERIRESLCGLRSHVPMQILMNSQIKYDTKGRGVALTRQFEAASSSDMVKAYNEQMYG